MTGKGWGGTRTYEIHFGYENGGDKGDDLDVGEEDEETFEFVHDSGFCEYRYMSAVIAHDFLGINNKEKCCEECRTHDDDTGSWSASNH